MHEFIKKIRQLIASDKIKEAMDELEGCFEDKDDDLIHQLINHKATLLRSRRDSRQGLISNGEENQIRARIRLSVLEMLSEIENLKNEMIHDCKENVNLPSVFISYNHDDSIIANHLKSALQENGILVKIDSETMKPGEKIKDFIENSIKETDVTLLIVSNKSLLSAWVSMETILTFYYTKFTSNKKFIACYIDDDFFQPGFHLGATKKIDARIDEIDKLIPEYIQNKIDTISLNNEKTRLYHLRNNLGDILLGLKNSLSLDIREDKFEESVKKIITMQNERK